MVRSNKNTSINLKKYWAVTTSVFSRNCFWRKPGNIFKPISLLETVKSILQAMILTFYLCLTAKYSILLKVTDTVTNWQSQLKRWPSFVLIFFEMIFEDQLYTSLSPFNTTLLGLVLCALILWDFQILKEQNKRPYYANYQDWYFKISDSRNTRCIKNLQNT